VAEGVVAPADLAADAATIDAAGIRHCTGREAGGDQTDLAWLIFERGYPGKAEVDRLHRDGDNR